MAEILSAESKGRLAENLELFSKIGPTQVLAHHLQFNKFLFRLHQIRSVMPKFGIFCGAFIVDEISATHLSIR